MEESARDDRGERPDTTDGRSSHPPEEGVVLDPDQLSRAALRGLVEEYVTREGTDYGSGHEAGGADTIWTLDEKVAQVLAQIEAGEAQIVFDLESETASIIPVTRSASRPTAPEREGRR